MKFLFLLISILSFSFQLKAQDSFLAKQYFEEGQFDKAVIFYEQLVKKNPSREAYAENLVICYQQLERFQEAHDYLQNKLKRGYKSPSILVDIGYNYQLQGQQEEANRHYDKALKRLEDNPNYGYGLAMRFQGIALVDRAIESFETAMAKILFELYFSVGASVWRKRRCRENDGLLSGFGQSRDDQ